LHLYAIVSNVPRLAEEQLTEELMRAGEEFALDPATAWTAVSRGGAIRAAGVHHGTERCGHRRYLARSGSQVTLFDGLPVEREGRFQACDAEALAMHWQALEDSLEGQFNAVQLDLVGGRAEILLDPLGLVQVFVARRHGGIIVSNSATLTAALSGLRSPDPLGVSSLMGLGWAAGESTLTRDVRVLCGGARHTLTAVGLQTRRHFGPQTIPGGGEDPLTAGELAATLTTLTASAVRGIDRVGCALTAGRDTRVLAALMQAAGEHALYFTGGTADHPDVVIARELARRLGLEHEVVCHDPSSSSLDWTNAAARFIRQNDGLVSLLQLPDYIDLSLARPRLGVKLGGVGGEIGRTGIGALTAAATNVPVLRSSARAQRRLLAMKVRNESGLMTSDAMAELARYLDSFREERLGEGWRPQELQEAFYTFERVGRWGASGRRMAGTDDAFLPLCARPFISYCFTLSSAERYVEAAHYRLLTELSPELRDHRFDFPFPGQRTWLVPVRATGRLVKGVGEQVISAPAGPNGDVARVCPEYPFQHAWFEARLDLMRDLFSVSNSDLWRFISRRRIQALLDGTEADRAANQEDLLRATTIFWHFHGPRP